jgi:YidC/Oxa1 family membrane protein insertase
MNDIRRTILWVIFGFSMVLLWDKWQLHNGNKATFFPTTPAVTAPAAAGAASGATGAASVPSSGAPAATAGASAVPGQPAAAPAAPAPRERIEVKSDLYRLVFDSEGGSLTQAELLQHIDMADKARNFLLLDESAQRVYVAQTGLIGGAFPTHKTAMTVVPGPRELKDGEDEISIRFESPEQGGLKLVKTWTVKRGAYDIAVKHEVVNTGTTAVSPQLYLQLVRDGNKPPGESSFYSTFTGPAVYTDAKKYQKIEFKDIDNGKVDIPKDSPNGYVAMVQHYFATAWLLADGTQRELFTRKVDTNLYSVGMLTSLGAIEPGATKAVDARLFAGPQVETQMEKLYPGLELVLAAGPTAQAAEQLGLVHRGPGAAAQDRVLLAQRQGLRQHGQDEGHQPAHHGNARAPQGQTAADAAGNDADLPRGEGQPDGRLLPHHDPDPGVHCAVLGAAVQRRDAQRALDRLDHRPVHARPVLHPAPADDGQLAAADRAEPRAARSNAGQDDVVHAADLQRDVLLLPGRPGAVLADEQHPVDCTAVDHQHPHGCATTVQLAQVQVTLRR